MISPLHVSLFPVDIVKYLLTSAELTQHANLDAVDDCLVRICFERGHGKVVQFLLHDMQIAVTPRAYQGLNESMRQEMRHMVEKRDFFLRMNKTLSPEETQVEAVEARMKI